MMEEGASQKVLCYSILASDIPVINVPSEWKAQLGLEALMASPTSQLGASECRVPGAGLGGGCVG